MSSFGIVVFDCDIIYYILRLIIYFFSMLVASDGDGDGDGNSAGQLSINLLGLGGLFVTVILNKFF